MSSAGKKLARSNVLFLLLVADRYIIPWSAWFIRLWPHKSPQIRFWELLVYPWCF